MQGKGILLATVSSLAILGAADIATAADLPARMPVKAPVVEPAASRYAWAYIRATAFALGSSSTWSGRFFC